MWTVVDCHHISKHLVVMCGHILLLYMIVATTFSFNKMAISTKTILDFTTLGYDFCFDHILAFFLPFWNLRISQCGRNKYQAISVWVIFKTYWYSLLDLRISQWISSRKYIYQHGLFLKHIGILCYHCGIWGFHNEYQVVNTFISMGCF